MKVWVLLFFNCIKIDGNTPKYTPVRCQTTPYSQEFTTKKSCELEKKTVFGKEAKQFDSQCVKVTVWRN